MKRVLICFLCAVTVVAAIFAYLFFHPDIAARVFLGTAPSPVEMNIRRVHDVPAADRKTADIVAAAKHFLDSLADNQRRAGSYRFVDNAQRSNWSNFPESMVARGGVKLGTLSEAQRVKLDRILGELLSEDGVKNITCLLAADDMLVPGKLFGVMKYGRQYYYAAILGEPSTTEPWMFQFGGHHLAINATVFGPNVSFSPMQTGGQPLHLRLGDDDIFTLRRRKLRRRRRSRMASRTARENKPFVPRSPSTSCRGLESLAQHLRRKVSRAASFRLCRERCSWM